MRAKLRRLSVALFATVLLTITWGHAQPPKEPRVPHVAFEPLPYAKGMVIAPGLVVEAAWQLTGNSQLFGGFSTLHAEPDGSMVSLSDLGRIMEFRDPSRGDPDAKLHWFNASDKIIKEMRDSEALTVDRATDTWWIGYEYQNAIARYHPKTGQFVSVRPPEMRHWQLNSGPEAVARLPDGRFVVVAEARERGSKQDGNPGLLFPRDPVAGARPLKFRFIPPTDYFPSDATALPDGRVIMIVRRLTWPFPPRFTAKLLLADPAMIRAGKPWPWRELAMLDSPLPMDNYEGISVLPRSDGKLTMWLISDDNQMVTQRTLLLKLVWDWKAGTQKRAGSDPARFLNR